MKKRPRKNTADEKLAANLKNLTRWEGLTAADLYGVMEMSETTYYKRLSNPVEFTMGNILRAAAVLRVKPEDLIGREITQGEVTP